jgi:hypothetical protein
LSLSNNNESPKGLQNTAELVMLIALHALFLAQEGKRKIRKKGSIVKKYIFIIVVPESSYLN